MNRKGFSGKTAIITGAASGMGRVAARMLSQQGASVVLCDVNEKALCLVNDEISTDGKAYPCIADVR